MSALSLRVELVLDVSGAHPKNESPAVAFRGVEVEQLSPILALSPIWRNFAANNCDLISIVIIIIPSSTTGASFIEAFSSTQCFLVV